jgi:hypothetical protein
MLGSITPLGERGRGSRWWLSVTAYVLGSLAGGAVFGAALGWASTPLAFAATGPRLALLGAAVATGLAIDLGVLGARLPTVHRQVDEAWRTRYRGWVWGLGFGLQLGTGVVTIVTTSLVYATWTAALLSGTTAAGAAIGATFGLARALPVLAVRRVHRSDQLVRVQAVLSDLAVPARRTAYAASALLASAAFLGTVRS